VLGKIVHTATRGYSKQNVTKSTFPLEVITSFTIVSSTEIKNPIPTRAPGFGYRWGIDGCGKARLQFTNRKVIAIEHHIIRRKWGTSGLLFLGSKARPPLWTGLNYVGFEVIHAFNLQIPSIYLLTHLHFLCIIEGYFYDYY
jgi:hypothetical protein